MDGRWGAVGVGLRTTFDLSFFPLLSSMTVLKEETLNRISSKKKEMSDSRCERLSESTRHFEHEPYKEVTRCMAFAAHNDSTRLCLSQRGSWLKAQSESFFLQAAHIHFKIKLMRPTLRVHMIGHIWYAISLTKGYSALYSESFFELHNTKRHLFLKVLFQHDRHFSFIFSILSKIFENYISFYDGPNAEKGHWKTIKPLLKYLLRLWKKTYGATSEFRKSEGTFSSIPKDSDVLSKRCRPCKYISVPIACMGKY